MHRTLVTVLHPAARHTSNGQIPQPTGYYASARNWLCVAQHDQQIRRSTFASLRSHIVRKKSVRGVSDLRATRQAPCIFCIA